MAIRNIVKEGDPILNKVCRPVTNFDDRLATLLDDMRETMIDADGVGLAGPQVGMLRRLFVVWDTTDAPEEIPADYEYKFIDFVNPEILAVSEDEETAYEGCLSFPGHNGAVTRPAAVKVRAQDRNGNWFELEAEGLLARCIQHENDHLDVDEVISVPDDEAIRAGRELAATEGLLAGISSGAAVYAARLLAGRPEFKNKKIVALLPDTGERYLSTELFAFDAYPLD